MITLYTIEMVINIVASIIAYSIIATLSGYAIAYCAAKAGDYADQQEYLSLNPIVHTDILGVLCLICCGLGWGRSARVNYERFKNPHKKLKIGLVAFAQATSYFWIVILAFIALIKIMSRSIIQDSLSMILTGDLSLSSLTATYPQHSSIALVLSIILMNICYLGLLLGTLDLLRIGLERLIIWLRPGDQASQQTYMLFLPLLIFIIWGFNIRIALFNVCSALGFFVAHLLSF